MADPEKALADALEQKKATDKQMAYIAGLLDKLGLTLEESYHKADYDDLTTSLELHDGKSDTA